jgi:hypothetical protein
MAKAGVHLLGFLGHLAGGTIVLAWLGCGSPGLSVFGGGGSTGAGGLTATGASATTTSNTMTTVTSTVITTTGGGGASTSSSSSASSGATSSGAQSGDCQKGSDCPSGQCVAVTPGGFQVCVVAPRMAAACTGVLDQCCPADQAACDGGAPCYVGPLVPVCSGIAVPAHNVCGVDQCQKDVDCAAGHICAPAGTLGLEIRACVVAACEVDADCAAYAGGECAPVQDPCCGTTAGLFCVYPADGGCRKNADCPPTTSQPSRFCSPDPIAGVATCQPGGPVCPG